jgi:hypothetical protein
MHVALLILHFPIDFINNLHCLRFLIFWAIYTVADAPPPPTQ